MALPLTLPSSTTWSSELLQTDTQESLARRYEKHSKALLLEVNVDCVLCFFWFQVYFLWICPSHKHFEWFIDVLRDVERKDVTNVLEIHIFITQFFHKFDLRTTMLVSFLINTQFFQVFFIPLLGLCVTDLPSCFSTFARTISRGSLVRPCSLDLKQSITLVVLICHLSSNLFKRSTVT